MGTFFFHARIWRGEGQFSSAMLVRRGRIAALGETETLRELAGDCDFIDCGGRVMIPGFQDVCLCLAAACSPVVPESCRNWIAIREACLRWLEEHPRAGKKGLYACVHFGGTLPERGALDAVLPSSPLVLEDVGAGTAVLNTCALERLEQQGIPAEDLQWLRRRSDGQLSGVVQGPACRSAAAVVPEPSRKELRDQLRRMLQNAAAQGVTALQSCDPGLTLPEKVLPLLERMYQENAAFPRMQCFRWPQEGRLPGHLRTSGMTRQPTRGGVLLLQQSDRVHFAYSSREMHSLVRQAGREGMQLWVRGGGRAQLEEVLKEWEQIPDGQENFRRLVLLDVRETDRELLRRLGKGKLGTVLLPGRPGTSVHCPARTLDALGAHVGFAGLDGCHPFRTLQQMIQLPPAERLSREKALEIHTRGNAWLWFREDALGKLAPGYGADVQLLDRDCFTCPAEEIGSIRPVLVMAAGRALLREI